jgi:asparagine synthase (glutamine-hydrolysing)
MTFLLLVRPGGAIAEAEGLKYAAARCCSGLDTQWLRAGSCSAFVAGNGAGCRPEAVRWGSLIGVGVVRLDNREELARRTGCSDDNLGDLALVLRVIAQDGKAGIVSILGDFAVVIWDHATRSLTMMRDAFGVKQLFYREQADLLSFASRAELLASGDEYNREFLTAMAAHCRTPADQTVYAGVQSLPAGSMGFLRGGRLVTQQYWSADHFDPSPVPAHRHQELCHRFRDLFTQSVQLRLTGAHDTWAQLSGGLDSSSVVSAAQWLVQTSRVPVGVSGTVSWVYRWSPEGDERLYSRAVVQRFGVRNEVLANDWFWKADGRDPPLTDQPDVEYPLYARERRALELITRAGGRILLTGFGSDNYLLGNMFFFADWLARGRVRHAVHEMLRRAAIGRASFWELAYQNAVLPLLPGPLLRVVLSEAAMPRWITPCGAQRLGRGAQTAMAKRYAGRAGHKYAHVVRTSLGALPSLLRRHDILEEALDVRHPFLYRPLVEFALRLPPEMCVRPHARKWILREAMKGILPELVRTRVGKGANPGCLVQSLIHESDKIDRMLLDPILGQLGCINPKEARRALDAARRADAKHACAALLPTLALETWLQVRSGRWVAGGT